MPLATLLVWLYVRLLQQAAVPQKLAASALHKSRLYSWVHCLGLVAIAVLPLPYTEKDLPPRTSNSFKSLLITLLQPDVV